MLARHPSSVLLPERYTHCGGGLTPSVPKSAAKDMTSNHHAFLRLSDSPEAQ